MAAEAAVSFAVKTLGNLLIEKATFLKGVEGDVRWLRNELKRMQCLLKDAANKQSNSDSIRNWISEIRELAHDAEDSIELFVLNVQSRGRGRGRGRGLLGSCTRFPNYLYHLNKVGEAIKSIRKGLKDVEDSRLRYGIQGHFGDRQSSDSSSQLEVESRRRLAHWQKDKNVVGLKKDVEWLLGKAIFSKIEGLSVATITGMGGIGKSTLASKIYNHPAVANRFEWRAWVVVSSEFTPEDVVKQIMIQLSVSADDLKILESVQDNLGRQENLKKELHKRLTGKRYFIVLDDVWEATHWESLSTAFPDEDNASRLLLTSRNQVLTMHSRYARNMKVLDANKSWKLFLRKAFVDNTSFRSCPEELKNVAEEILKKCKGLPLAISVVGALLAKKAMCKTEWEKVLNEMQHHLDTSGDINTISAILELSYQNLPPELKACFLCFAFLKEDVVVKADDLVHLWVALGLVPQEERNEDVAREYLNELISRNMVQAKEIEYDKVKACHVHDLLHDLAIRKAKEGIGFEVRREDRKSHESLHKRPRHRAIHYNKQSFVYSTKRNQYLRSLFNHGDEQYCFDIGPSSFWKSFELLKILDMGNAKLRVLPGAIGVLKGLKYLKMRYSGVTTILPESWSRLKSLEVLDLRCYSSLIIIHKVILEMDCLIHLYSHISYSEVCLGNIRNLKTLSLFKVKDSDLWQIHGMAGVSTLEFDMSRMSDGSTLFTYLATLENLVSLTLKHHEMSVNMEGLSALHHITQLKLEDFGFMEKLPGDFPPSLSYLTLCHLWVTEDPMPVLGRLPKLLYLKLNNAYRGEEMVVSSCGFPCLKVLHLQCIRRLRNMEMDEAAMPELNQFIIRDCPKLKIENLAGQLKSAITDSG